MVEEGFLKPSNRELLHVAETLPSLLAKMISSEQVAEEKWMERGQE
jgi:hypothetical protein